MGPLHRPDEFVCKDYKKKKKYSRKFYSGISIGDPFFFILPTPGRIRIRFQFKYIANFKREPKTFMANKFLPQ